jgi:hypothetical protein
LRNQPSAGIDHRLAASEAHFAVDLGQLVEILSMVGAVEAVVRQEAEAFERLGFGLCDCFWAREAPGTLNNAESASSCQSRLD